MKVRACMCVFVVLSVVGTLGLPATTDARKDALDNAFKDPVTVEAIIDCFLDKVVCDKEQSKIKERAFATMRNFGQCPKEICTAEEREEMTRAMTLLQQNHKDLWKRLIASMFNIDLSGK